MYIIVRDEKCSYSDDYSYKADSIVIWGDIRECYVKNQWRPFKDYSLGALMSLFENKIEEFVRNVSGSFVGFYESNTHYVFCSSSEARRVYFSNEKDGWIFTDSVEKILPKTKSTQIDSFEYEYYLLNGFSSGFSTYLKGVYKMLPGEIIDCANEYSFGYRDRVEHSCLLNTVSSNRSAFSDVDSFESFFNERLLNSLIEKNNLAILFSGGADSTFLLQSLQRVFPQKEIVPICFYSPQLPSASILSDKEKATNISNRMGFKLEIVNPLEEESLEETLMINNSKMPFDAHISFWHGGSLRQLEGKYDCIITGQNADGMYNFGATGKFRPELILKKLRIKQAGIAELFKRALFEDRYLIELRKGKRSHHFFILYLLTRYYKMPDFSKSKVSYDDFLKGFLSGEQYVPYLFTDTFRTLNNSSEYEEKLQQIADAIDRESYSVKAQLTFLKLIGFVQGSDMRVLTELFSTPYLNDVFFPYTSLPAIEAFSDYPLERKDTINAKQYIYKSLERQGIYVFDYVEDYHKAMLTDGQVWRIINSYFFKIIPDSYNLCMETIDKIPNSVNKTMIINEFKRFTEDQEYNVTLIFRFLWSVPIINGIRLSQ